MHIRIKEKRREEKRKERSGIVDEEGVMKRGMEEQQGEDLFGSLDIWVTRGKRRMAGSGLGVGGEEWRRDGENVIAFPIQFNSFQSFGLYS